jgi:hypothetical protein
MGRTRRRKRRTHINNEGEKKTTVSEEKPPLSIVIGRGKLNQAQQRLVLDIRKVSARNFQSSLAWGVLPGYALSPVRGWEGYGTANREQAADHQDDEGS